MSKSWQVYAQHILDTIDNLGDIDAQTVEAVIRQHLPPLKSALQDMLSVQGPGKS